jgi:hypothetical protein
LPLGLGLLQPLLLLLGLLRLLLRLLLSDLLLLFLLLLGELLLLLSSEKKNSVSRKAKTTFRNVFAQNFLSFVLYLISLRLACLSFSLLSSSSSFPRCFRHSLMYSLS